MSRTTYDEALLVAIADRANAGEDVRALAEEHNLAYKPLYLALLRRGRFVRRHHRWWTKKEIAAALAKMSEGEPGASRASTTAMANLAEGIQGLVKHMRSEQQMIRDWVEAQAEQQREMRKLLERLGSESERR